MYKHTYLIPSINGAFVQFWRKYEDQELLFVIFWAPRFLNEGYIAHNWMQLAMLFIFLSFRWSPLPPLLQWFPCMCYSVLHLCFPELAYRSRVLFQNMLMLIRTFILSGLWMRPPVFQENHPSLMPELRAQFLMQASHWDLAVHFRKAWGTILSQLVHGQYLKTCADHFYTYATLRREPKICPRVWGFLT